MQIGRLAPWRNKWSWVSACWTISLRGPWAWWGRPYTWSRLVSPGGASGSWKTPSDPKGPCFRHSSPPAAFEPSVVEERNWRMWWRVNQFGWPSRQDHWRLFPWARSSYTPSVLSSSASPRRCGARPYRQGMVGSHLVYSGRCYLPVPPGSCDQHWYLLNLPLGFPSPCSSVAAVLLGFGFV